mmetsp:Transcript_5368/g.11300  ORF Transcript_5368/g.11300 Transcript_5368/m.11300 type:complete len:111 (+) Transcript_5368:377-709(+)
MLPSPLAHHLSHSAKPNSILTKIDGDSAICSNNTTTNTTNDSVSPDDEDMDFLDEITDFYNPTDDIATDTLNTDDTPPVTTPTVTNDRLSDSTDSEWNSGPWSTVLYRKS